MVAADDKSSPSKWSNHEFWENRFRDKNTPWDLGGPCPTLQHLESQTPLDRSSKTKVIVPGCGRGHDVLELARLGYEVTAFDVSETALADLKEQALARGLSENIQIEKQDFWNLPSSWDGKFDLWVEYTFLCALDPHRRADYPPVAARLLKSGGQLIGGLFLKEGVDQTASVFDDGEIPFLTDPTEIREIFSNHFELKSLEVSSQAKRLNGIEWAAHFINK